MWAASASSSPAVSAKSRPQCIRDPSLRLAGRRLLRPLPLRRASVNNEAPVDWDTFEGFALRETDSMYVAKCRGGETWNPGKIEPYGNLSFSPAAGILNYGQGVFEGIKAYRTEKNRIVTFRPDKNAERCAEGCARLSMPPVPQDMFVDAVKQVVRANTRWVPPKGRGALYIRPLVLGSGPVLGLAPAPEYTFLIYVSPVGNYFKSGLEPIHLVVDPSVKRAAPGGTGGVKHIGNYAPVLQTQRSYKGAGYSDVLYLDAVHNKYVEEVSSCNIFALGKDGTVRTPRLSGTILPGITRMSIIQLLKDKGFPVEELDLSIDQLMDASEVFCTGTAVVLAGVGSVTYNGIKAQFSQGSDVGPVTRDLYDTLTGIQSERLEDPYLWVVEVEH